MKKFFINETSTFQQMAPGVQRTIVGHFDNLMLVAVHFEKGGIGEVHAHEDHEQISYVASGTFEVTIGDEKKILKQGDGFIADKNVPHGALCLEDGVLIDSFTPQRKDFL